MACSAAGAAEAAAAQMRPAGISERRAGKAAWARWAQRMDGHSIGRRMRWREQQCS